MAVKICFHKNSEGIISINIPDPELNEAELIKGYLKTSNFKGCLALEDEGIYINLEQITHVTFREIP